MLSVVARWLRKWGVTLAGLMLLLCGLSAMWTGWDQILIERGWSLFIAGAALIAGGAVTASIGLLLARLDASSSRRDSFLRAAAAIQTKPADRPAEAKVGEAGRIPTPKQGSEPMEPSVIDRYESGDATYVMYSDGSVEVCTELGKQRYASVSDLRADMDP